MNHVNYCQAEKKITENILPVSDLLIILYYTGMRPNIHCLIVFTLSHTYFTNFLTYYIYFILSVGKKSKNTAIV